MGVIERKERMKKKEIKREGEKVLGTGREKRKEEERKKSTLPQIRDRWPHIKEGRREHGP